MINVESGIVVRCGKAAAVGVSFIPQIRLGSYILLLIMSALWIVPDLRMKRVYPHLIVLRRERII